MPALGPALAGPRCRAVLESFAGRGAGRPRPSRCSSEQSLMFTGIVTDVGEVASVERAPARSAASASASYDPADDRARRLDRLPRPVPDRRRGRPARGRLLVRGRRRRRDAGPHHGRRLAAGHPHQPRALAEDRRRARRAYRHRPCRRRGEIVAREAITGGDDPWGPTRALRPSARRARSPRSSPRKARSPSTARR